FFFRSEPAKYNFLPFRFMEFDGKQILVNEVGEHCFLDHPTFDAFVSKSLPTSHPAYSDLKAKHFLWDSGLEIPVQLLTVKYRTKKSFLAGFTRLHIFVVSLRCDHSCHYCQVSRQTVNKGEFDMTEETATAAVNMMLKSPSQHVTLELQGGEPLLAFDIIKHIVSLAKPGAARL